MAATGYTPIRLYNSTTALAVPLAANLAAGELALNITDGKLYYNDGGTVKLLASNGASSPVTSFSAGTTGLTPNTATTGAITLAGTLGTANGGTNLTSFTSGGAMYATSTSALTTGTLPVTAGGTGLATITAGRILFGNGTSALGNSANLFWDSSNNRLGVGTASPAVTVAISATDAILLPVGTTGQRPTGATGYLRFNTTTAAFEGYNGTSWTSVGGANVTNDTTTATALYPLFANVTTGAATNVYTSNAKLLYTPSNGELQSAELYANNGVLTHANQVTTSYTVPTNANVITVGPWTVASGATFTLPSGSRQVLL
jgi:hypothetical protein